MGKSDAKDLGRNKPHSGSGITTPKVSEPANPPNSERSSHSQNSTPMAKTVGDKDDRGTGAQRANGPTKPAKVQQDKNFVQGLSTRMEKCENLMLTQAQQTKEFQNMMLNQLQEFKTNSQIYWNEYEEDYEYGYDHDEPQSENIIPDPPLHEDMSLSNESVPLPNNNINNSKDGSALAASALPSTSAVIDNTSTATQPSMIKPVDKASDLGFAARFAVIDTLGDSIQDSIASGIDYLSGNPPDTAELSNTYDKYKCPSNCTNLVVPLVNSEIWNNVPSHTRSWDLKLQKLQKPLVTGIIALARGLSATDSADLEHQDALALLTSANFELNCLRKESIKPSLNSKYHHLCKPDVKVTRNLFGDNLSQQVKEIAEVQKTAMGVTMRPRGNFRQHPYSRPYTRPQFTQGYRSGLGLQNNFLGRGFRPGFKSRTPYMYNRQARQRGRGWGRGRGYQTPFQNLTTNQKLQPTQSAAAASLGHPL
ncbi:uncharacterized protein [Amphiura filiformis]|uniref:uncharacterized protein n=1 Tax=Amphiura filiformis TaxID=82378 RepID=UPI003B21FFF2